MYYEFGPNGMKLIDEKNINPERITAGYITLSRLKDCYRKFGFSKSTLDQCQEERRYFRSSIAVYEDYCFSTITVTDAEHPQDDEDCVAVYIKKNFFLVVDVYDRDMSTSRNVKAALNRYPVSTVSLERLVYAFFDSIVARDNRVLEDLEFKIHKLEEGSYTCRIQADSVIYAYAGEKIVKQVDTQLLWEQSFCVAKEEKKETASAEPVVAEVTPVQEQPTEPAAAEEPVKNGWYYENQTWYCYKQGVPCAGWVRSAGVDYYLKEDGSVTTGWAVVDGRQRLFTATGAVYSGWLKNQDGVRYLDECGVPVYGWQWIDGAYCRFDEKGFLQKKFVGSVLRQLRQMGMTKEDLLAAEAAKNSEPQEE